MSHGSHEKNPLVVTEKNKENVIKAYHCKDSSTHKDGMRRKEKNELL